MARYKSPNGTGRVGRDKKRKALESDEYKENIENLAQRGITPENIEIIYNKCQEKPQTKITKHTLAAKLIELLDFFDERNKGLEETNKGFISKDDVIKIIMRNPRIINSNIENNIIAKCQIITQKKGNIKEANMLIKSNPGIFRKTGKAIREGK